MNEGVVLDNGGTSRPLSLRTSILLKREGICNVWHSLMEIISLSWSLDLLQITLEADTGRPLLSPKDNATAQIVIIDNQADGASTYGRSLPSSPSAASASSTLLSPSRTLSYLFRVAATRSGKGIGRICCAEIHPLSRHLYPAPFLFTTSTPLPRTAPRLPSH